MSMKEREMHQRFIDDLYAAYQQEHYFKVSWLCYSIMEQRISRMIGCYLDLCPNPARTDAYSLGIRIRIACIRHLIHEKYGAYNPDIWSPRAKNIHKLDQLLININNWCKGRNELVHALISPEHLWNADAPSVNAYDEDFQKLADDGIKLVKALYSSASSVNRKWKSVRADWQKSGVVPPFPLCKDCQNIAKACHKDCNACGKHCDACRFYAQRVLGTENVRVWRLNQKCLKE